MVILRVTSILGGQKEDKWMICSIPQVTVRLVLREAGTEGRRGG
jgi:hypothetical protein